MNVGIDLVDCARVKKIATAQVFSARELAYIAAKNHALTTIAGLFAAKEAYFKAKGTGIIKSQLPQVEVDHDENGRPFYAHDKNACLSITHTETTAAAVCIIF